MRLRRMTVVMLHPVRSRRSPDVVAGRFNVQTQSVQTSTINDRVASWCFSNGCSEVRTWCGSSGRRAQSSIIAREAVSGVANLEQHRQSTGILDDIVAVDGLPELAPASPRHAGGASGFGFDAESITVSVGVFWPTVSSRECS